MIVVGFRFPGEFVGCRTAATIDNGVDLDNEERGGTVYLCDRPRRAWRELWPTLRHLDA